MREPYGEGVATHSGPESCVGFCKGAREALTGVRASRVLSRETSRLRGAEAVQTSGRPYGGVREREDPNRSRVVGDPWHVRNLHAREPGDPSAGHEMVMGRIGKAEAAIQ